MKAITVRQPWAWAIFNAGKDVENRDWYTHFRGKVAVHAALGITRVEYQKASKYIRTISGPIQIPILEKLERGAIIGVVEIKGCVQESDSLWFEGKYGCLLASPELLRESISCKGGSGFGICRKMLRIASSELSNVASRALGFSKSNAFTITPGSTQFSKGWHTISTQNKKAHLQWVP